MNWKLLLEFIIIGSLGSLGILTFAGVLENPLEQEITQGVDYMVECPPEIKPTCQELSENHTANTTFQYKTEYTNREGTAYFVQLSSKDEIKGTNTTQAIAYMDGSGKVWSIGDR